MYKMRKDQVDGDTLTKAFKSTCEYRETIFTKEKAMLIISEIQNDETMKKRWNMFRKKNSFASELEFKQTIKALLYWTEIIYKNSTDND